MTPARFVAVAREQRDLWMKNTARASTPPVLAQRLRRVAHGLQVLVIAEDWCPDSVNTVPYIAALMRAADVEMRIVDRKNGDVVMQSHRTPDGRKVTPTVVLLRNGRDAGAWIERPVPLQQAFRAMARDPKSAELFAKRQEWYDADGGRTTLAEIVALAERSASAP